MTFEEYEKKASETAVYPDRGSNLVYPILKLSGESGEVAELMGKYMRGDYGPRIDDGMPTGLREKFIKEVGDVLWYISAIAYELGIPMSVIAETNIAKLASRKERGVLKGSGDER